MRDFEDYCWRDLLTPEMARVYAAYHRPRALTARPALVVIHPPASFAAGQAWQGHARRLADAVRASGLAVVHSVPPGEAAHATLAPLPGEACCRRAAESAFLFSDLELQLTRARADGVILCGAPTSGALRASCVESKSFGYRTAVAEDATGDEAGLLHKMALFDLAHKYADVMSTDEIVDALPSNLTPGVA
jgi:maleamate amidohydrolase